MKSRTVFNGVFTIVLFVLSCIPLHVCAQETWKVEDVKSSLKESIKFMFQEFKPKEGILLEITGTFTATDLKNASLDTSEIFLTITSGAQTKKIELTGIGIVGEDGKTGYIIPEMVSKGGATITQGSQVFKFNREEKEGPVVVTILRDSTRLCLAFIVPQDSKEEYELQFGNLKVKVPSPASPALNDKTGQVKGMIVEVKTHQPVEKSISLFKVDGIEGERIYFSGEPVVEVKSDLSGTFVFQNVPPGNYVIFAQGMEINLFTVNGSKFRLDMKGTMKLLSAMSGSFIEGDKAKTVEVTPGQTIDIGTILVTTSD